MTKQKQKRKYIDWDGIEPLYRAGNLSLHKICDQYEMDHINSQVWKITVTHAAILKKAKEKEWTRDLAKKVQKRIQEKLVTSLVTTSNKKAGGGSDEENIERAAELGSGVVFRHRDEIFELKKYEADLLKELSEEPTKLYLANFQGQIIQQEVGLTVTEKSVTLKNLAAVRAQRIGLEREAHNLDNGPAPPDSAKIIISDNMTEEEAAEICRNVLG